MPPKQTEPTAGKLARGPVKTQDIEAARRHLDHAERRVSRELRVAAARRERAVMQRERSAPWAQAR